MLRRYHGATAEQLESRLNYLVTPAIAILADLVTYDPARGCAAERAERAAAGQGASDYGAADRADRGPFLGAGHARASAEADAEGYDCKNAERSTHKSPFGGLGTCYP